MELPYSLRVEKESRKKKKKKEVYQVMSRHMRAKEES